MRAGCCAAKRVDLKSLRRARPRAGTRRNRATDASTTSTFWARTTRGIARARARDATMARSSGVTMRHSRSRAWRRGSFLCLVVVALATSRGVDADCKRITGDKYKIGECPESCCFTYGGNHNPRWGSYNNRNEFSGHLYDCAFQLAVPYQQAERFKELHDRTYEKCQDCEGIWGDWSKCGVIRNPGKSVLAAPKQRALLWIFLQRTEVPSHRRNVRCESTSWLSQV